MRTITAEIKAEITDAAAAGLIGNLTPAVIEKDYHVTAVLRALAALRLSHTVYRAGTDKAMPAQREIVTRLVFAGGTCLSKAHGLIERMSEDIDIKVDLEAVPEGYKLAGSTGDRARLKGLHDEIQRILTGLDFEFDVVENLDNPVVRDNRRYYCLMVSYAAQFQDVTGVLRPQLKLELIHRPPFLDSGEHALGTMFDVLVGDDSPDRFEMTCISVAETLGEKVLSLLRRCAWKWDGYQRGEFDSALVRHVYDVSRIMQERPDQLTAAKTVFAALVSKDVAEFGAQHPEFAQDPYGVLRNALSRATADAGLKEDFEKRLTPLLYAENRPTFDACFADFDRVASELLDSVPAP